ncbi:MAG: hypothetical protein IMZ67_05905 [Acidobacteria bacterium]|nr:hypothetical protein [Acidobacteriota bacterium]MBE3135369.1 hypothetical protein [Acidobacteriota bacterium]
MCARRFSLTVLIVPVLAATTALMAACGGPAVPLDQTLKVTDVVTGWYDAGIVEVDKNKLVPSISFRVTNIGMAPVSSVYVTLSFRQIGDPQEWGSAYVKAVGPEGLKGGASTQPMVVRSTFGYKAPQPRLQMLRNREFRDAQVSLFAKSGTAAPVKIGEFKIDRQLLTR